MSRFEHAHARLAIGLRSCRTESMLLSERMAFFQCVSFSVCRFSLSVFRIPSGQWQVKISRDCALQSSKPFLCRDHSWRRLKAPSCACSDPAFTLVRTSLRRSSTLCSPCHGSTSGSRRPSGGNASSSRSPSLAGISTSRPTSPCRVVSFCACALPHHTRRALTPRVLRHWHFLSPASKLDAAVPMVFRARTSPPLRQDGQHPRVGLVFPGLLSPSRHN